MRPTMVRLMEEYETYHLHPVNRLIHKIAVPAILFHVVAMIDWIGLGGLVIGETFVVTLAVPLLALVTLWYLWMAPGLGLAVSAVAWACLFLGRVTPWWVVVAVAVVAWIVQLIGHQVYEKRAPAFKDNLVQLLVGPVFVAGILTGTWSGPKTVAAAQ